MDSKFIYRGSQKLRCGYTTGSCAAGAAGAAAEMLLTGKMTEWIRLVLPKGDILGLEPCDCKISENYASCCIVKDSGDDPDITNGISVYAEVSKTPEGIEIIGGEGIGRVTRPGLDQPVGEFAINSVPRKMICGSVSEMAERYGYDGGFLIRISVPGGAEIAKKTFNPRMGIEGGISIIGTTGIVEPMSNSALIDTIRAEANIRRAEGRKNLVLTVGNYSEDLIAEKYPQFRERCVMCSNFIGDVLDIGVSLGFERILLIGHIGKLIKLGSGIMNTHSSYADGRIETLIACGALAGIGNDILLKISDCVTVDAALDILIENGASEKLLGVFTERAEHYLSARVKGEAEVGAVIFSFRNDIVLKTKKADDIINAASEEFI